MWLLINLAHTFTWTEDNNNAYVDNVTIEFIEPPLQLSLALAIQKYVQAKQ